MNVRLLSALSFSLALGAAAFPQDPPANSQSPVLQAPGGWQGGQGQRGGGRGGWGEGAGLMGGGRGVTGTVTAVAADHYSVKTDSGETYTVHFSANTRIIKQQAGPRGPGGGMGAGGVRGWAGRGGQGQGGSGEGSGMGASNPPQLIKPTDIKAGDAIAAMGEVDATAKSIGAVFVVLVDPERAKQLRELQANYGKTWLMGKVTAIDGVKVTILGSLDNAAHSFDADENTTFRKRREPITLADIQVGDNVRVEGAVKDGAFTASAVVAMTPPPEGAPRVPRNGPPPQ